MPICYTCGAKFHACSSCGLNNNWEYEFCCDFCYMNSLKYKESAIKIRELCTKLSMTVNELWQHIDIDDCEYDIDTEVLKEMTYYE